MFELLVKYQVFGDFGTIVWSMQNSIIPLDSANQVVLGAGMKRLEQVSRRIGGGITRIER